MGDSDRGGGERHLVLVARKPGFDLPTACPSCLPVYLYLKLANTPFTLQFDSSFPDSGSLLINPTSVHYTWFSIERMKFWLKYFVADHIPYVEYGESVALNNERGGVIEMLKENAIVDLNAKHTSLSIPDLVCLTYLLTVISISSFLFFHLIWMNCVWRCQPRPWSALGFMTQQCMNCGLQLLETLHITFTSLISLGPLAKYYSGRKLMMSRNSLELQIWIVKREKLRWFIYPHSLFISVLRLCQNLHHFILKFCFNWL